MKADDRNVGFFEMRVRPGFIGWLIAIFVILPLLASVLLPANGG